MEPRVGRLCSVGMAELGGRWLPVTLSQILLHRPNTLHTLNDSVPSPWSKNRHKFGLLTVYIFAEDKSHIIAAHQVWMQAIFLLVLTQKLCQFGLMLLLKAGGSSLLPRLQLQLDLLPANHFCPRRRYQNVENTSPSEAYAPWWVRIS